MAPNQWIDRADFATNIVTAGFILVSQALSMAVVVQSWDSVVPIQGLDIATAVFTLLVSFAFLCRVLLFAAVHSDDSVGPANRVMIYAFAPVAVIGVILATSVLCILVDRQRNVATTSTICVADEASEEPKNQEPGFS